MSAARDPSTDPPSGPPPLVPGHRVHRLLGTGSSGRVWAATAPDGTDVALKVVAGATAASLAVEVGVLCGLEHPHVLRLRSVVATSAGPALVLDRAHGGSLAALVGARGPLDPGEVVTVLTALAGAMADLHARGLVHGDVTAANVLFTGDGRPLLADWGLASVVGLGVLGAPTGGPAGHGGVHGGVHGRRASRPVLVPGTPGFADPARVAGSAPAPAGDVHGLAAVGWFALSGQVPPPGDQRPPLLALAPHVPAALVDALEQGLAPDPAQRPSPAELARACWEAAEAEPVRLVPTDPTAPSEEVITSRVRAAAAAARAEPAPPRRRRVLPVLAGVLALAGLVSGGALAIRAAVEPEPAREVVAAEEAPAPAPGAAPAAAPVPAGSPAADALRGDDPAAAVAVLASLRARAYAEADPGVLAAVDVAGSPAAAGDAAHLQPLAVAGTRLEGLELQVLSAAVVGGTADAPHVRTTVVTSAHRQVRDGDVVAEVPASEPVTSVLVLAREDGRWQVADTR